MLMQRMCFSAQSRSHLFKYPIQLIANDSKAINVFLQAATGRKAAFSLGECRKSETPRRARPPVLVDDGAGHIYRMSCASVRASDISKELAAALGITPKTLTGIGVEPQY